MKKLAIITTHPIQYNAPWFRLLNSRQVIQPRIFYTWSQSSLGSVYDPGFGKTIQWDIPLLDGYEYTFVQNTSKNPGTRKYGGIVNPSLIPQIVEWNPDAILVIGWNFKSHLECLRYFKGKIPVLFRGDSTLLDESPGFKKLVRRLFLKYIYRFVDIALYVGTNNRAYYIAHGLKENQLLLAPHAIDNDRFGDNANDERAIELRAKLGINPSDFVVLFAGKLEPKKNPEILLKMAHSMPGDHYKFLLVGNGVLENELKQKAAYDPRIMFLDFQNQLNMPVIYRIGDVFVLPSKGPGETWGLALNEAMASGRPVISTLKTGGAVDLIEHNINGVIIDFEKIDPAIDFITKLKENKGYWDLASMKSKEIIKRFEYLELARTIENIIKSKSYQ